MREREREKGSISIAETRDATGGMAREAATTYTRPITFERRTVPFLKSTSAVDLIGPSAEHHYSEIQHVSIRRLRRRESGDRVRRTCIFYVEREERTPLQRNNNVQEVSLKTRDIVPPSSPVVI